MRCLALVVCGALVGACDDATKTFGRSYDECILKNASKTPVQANLAEPSCRRRFERPSESGTGAEGTARLLRRGKEYLMTFSVSNTEPKKIITAVQTTAVFGDAGKNPEMMVWTFSTFIEPDDETELIGRIGEEPPALDFTTTVKVTRELPIVR